MKSTIRYNYDLLFLFFLLAALNTQAAIRKVTTLSTDASVEGSLFNITASLQDGDTITFDDALANQTITLEASKSINLSGGRLTVIGNGVTFSGAEIGAGISIYTGSLWIENLHFKDNNPSITGNPIHIRNCTFFTTQEADNSDFEMYMTVAATGASTFENCAFISKDANRRSPVLALNGNASLISCTFYKKEVSEDDYDYYNYHFITQNNRNDITEMTNCVIIDRSTDYYATFNNSARFRSRGYNVIMQGAASSDVVTTISGAQGDVYLEQTDAWPLTFDEGIWKVPLASPAYRHLPSQSTLDENDALRDITFPGKDLAGAGIDYTCKTHSGAWQTVYLADGETEPTPVCDATAVTEITLTPPTGTIYTETGTYTITATVTPSGASPVVTWTSSDPTVATIVSDGNSAGKITPLKAGTTTITATSTATPSVTAIVEITVNAYIHVAAITLEAGHMKEYTTPVDTLRSVHHLEYRIYANVSPADALNPSITWELEDPDGVVNKEYANADLCDLRGTKAGTAKLIAKATDGGITDTCVLIFTDPNYTDGVFMITEGNYPGKGRLNFLYPDGHWEYDLYASLNNPPAVRDNYERDFGVTSQFGTIYGGKFYVTSKQGARLVVFDPVTIEQHREYWSVPGDGRAITGVDENTLYMSTSNGVYVLNTNDLFSGSEKVVSALPCTPIEGTQSSGNDLYNGQIGSMIRVGERVFAVHQSKGIVVINATTHTVETLLDTYHYAVLTQSYDGYLWAGATVTESTGELAEPSEDGGQSGGLVDNVATYNALIRIDPWTLEEKVFPLPDGVGAPPSTWAAWQADPLTGSPTKNTLYWKDGHQLIRCYDIATGQVTTVFDASDNTACPLPAEFPQAHWSMYGPSFRIHPTTGDLYVWITLFHLQAPFEERMVWEVYRINPNTGEQLGYYPLKRTYWWPSLFVFPDNAAPEVDASFPSAVTLNATHRFDTLALRPLVTDADQMSAAIVKTITAIGDRTLVDAFIRHDSLFVTPLKDVTTQQTTTLALKFNSNGKVVTRNLDVTVQPGAIAHPVTGVSLNRTTATLSVGETLALTATVAPPNADNPALTWTSSQPLIASVDQNGTVTAHLAPGTVVITATTVQGSFTATCTVTTQAASTPGTVENPFELTQQTLSLYPDQTAQLALTAPQHFTVTWRSTNTSVATVTSTGLVTTLAAGTTYVIARDATKGKADSCLVTVTALPSPTPPAPSYTVSLNTSALTLIQGERSTLTVTVTPQQTGQTPVWSSSNPSVADVTSAGVVVAVSPGTAQIRATLGTVSATCAVTVTAQVTQPAVSEVQPDAAQLAFPRADNASYYLVHIYELSPTGFTPFLTLKVTPDGRATLLRSTAGNNLVVPLNYLSPATSYAVTIETVRETGGKAEVIRTEVTAFTTPSPTGLSSPEVTAANVFYAGGTLHLKGLAGYDCTLTSISGQALQSFRIVSSSDQRPLALPTGIYILSATNASEAQRKVFKLVIR